MSAEFLLKNYLEEQHIEGFAVSSAGTRATAPRESDPEAIATLRSYGIVVPERMPRRLTREDLNASDIVITFSDYHIDLMQKEFGFYDAILWNDILKGEKSNVSDIEDVVANVSDREAVMGHIRSTVTYLHDSMPMLYERIIALLH